MCESDTWCLLLLFICEAGVEPSPLLLQPFIGLLYQTWMIDGDDWVAISEMNDLQWKPKYSQRISPRVALSTTDLTWLDRGPNPDCRGWKPDTNRPIYGTVYFLCLAPPLRSRKLRVTTVGDPPRWPQKLALNFVDKWQSVSRYSSLAD
jgi:hypothetical protein